MQTLPWIVAFVASMLLATSLGAWAWHVRDRQRQRQEALPTDWALSARPVFSADERRVYRALREALPHHVLLPKLPLLRFCQPTEPGDVRYWHDLLGTSQVGFAICSANGRVLAAIDLDGDRDGSRRLARVKQAALAACRVRYLRCAVDQLPSATELQWLVPGAAADGAPSPPVSPARAAPPAPRPTRDVPPPRRSPHPVLWQDTTVFQDSFFPTSDSLDGTDLETFEPVAARRAETVARPAASRPAAAAGTRRRPVPSADFAPTLQGPEDEDDDHRFDDPDVRSRRFFPGHGS